MSILIFFLILLVLVLVHEAGHFFVAKFFKIRVDEFGFGFPPKLFGIKKGETEYTINALPIGGFVKIFGENPDEDSINGPDKDRSFVNKPRWQQALVLIAGVSANFLLAWVLLSFGFMSGLATSVDSAPNGYEIKDASLTIVGVAKNSPAKNAGLKSGDKIISIKSEKDFLENLNADSLKSFILENADKNIELNYTRGNNTDIVVANVKPVDNMIGISMDQIGILKLPFFPALWEGLKLDAHIFKKTLSDFGQLITGKVSFSAITGPVGMVGVVGEASKFGIAYLISFAALISVNLAVINLMPFPALDGGRLFFLLIEKIKGSRLSPKFANTANMIGFGLLLLLMLVVTVQDIFKLF